MKIKKIISILVTVTMVLSVCFISSMFSVSATELVLEKDIVTVDEVYFNGELCEDYSLDSGVLTLNKTRFSKADTVAIISGEDFFVYTVTNGIAEHQSELKNIFDYSGAAIYEENGAKLNFQFAIDNLSKMIISYGAVVSTEIMPTLNKTATLNGMSAFKVDAAAQKLNAPVTARNSLDGTDYLTEYFARPYAVFSKDNRTFLVYGAQVKDSIFSVAKKIQADENRGFELSGNANGEYISSILSACEYNKADYIKSSSVWNTPNFSDVGRDFEIQGWSLGIRDSEISNNSVAAYQLGNPENVRNSIFASEWAYSFLFLNGTTDGGGQEIVSGFPDGMTERSQALDYLKEYIYRQYGISEGDKWSSMNGYFNWQHYAGEFGASQIGSEIGENVNSYQMHIAFTRGAGRQYGKSWFIDFSPWYGGAIRDYSTTPVWDDSGSQNGGHSISLTERSFVASYMSGANLVIAEAGQSISLYDTLNEQGLYSLTPYGEMCSKFYKFVKNNRDVGTAYTPFGIVLDYYHGIEAGFTGEASSAGRQTIDKAFGYFDYNSGDNMTKELLKLFYGNSYYCTSNEADRVTNGIYADTADVLLQNASQSVLESYPVLILSGDINLSAEETARYKEYVENGGILVLNTAYLPYFSEYQAQYNNSGVQEIYSGNGKAIIYGEDYSVSSLSSIISELYSELVPLEITGDVQRIISMGENEIYVTLINNNGVSKTPTEAEVIDESVSTKVSVEFKNLITPKAAEDIYNGNVLDFSGKTTEVELSAGDIAVIKFSFN